jgi:hypothetical protein
LHRDKILSGVDIISEELDAQIAKKIMGIASDPRSELSTNCQMESLRPYSSDIAAAWEVLDKMEERGYVWRMDTCLVGFSPIEGPPVLHRHSVKHGVPEAICRAALKAVG